MINPLTKKQARLLEFIEAFIAQHGYAPTIREMAAGLGYSGSSQVHALLEQLVKKGYVSKVATGPRTIRVIKRLQEGQPDHQQTADLIEAARQLHEAINMYWQGDSDKATVIKAQSRLCDAINNAEEAE